MKAEILNLAKLIQSAIVMLFFSFKNKYFKLSNKDYKYTNFHSQFGEDRYLLEKIDLPQKGVFVDIGAGHPIYLSNTYFFEKNGWKGVCIDADINQVKLLKKERSNVEWAAISLEEGEINFFQAFLPELSTTVQKDEYGGLIKVPFKDTVRVPSFKLETILENYNIGVIDILDIDVEGTELEVWKTFDYEKHKPKVVIIEYYSLGLADNSGRIKDFFSKLPYQLVHTTCSNFIFVNNGYTSEIVKQT
ncbi:FkbM family methyltransferase [Mastigocladopsis repens]|uniref:FkbM family methyltransferase n=1 Tax=Mastigocladopsis repens TaxID=221287 RepID=UPI0002D97BA6|nr:FkbM family methyltransferase [Mastigocladopsis repens]